MFSPKKSEYKSTSQSKPLSSYQVKIEKVHIGEYIYGLEDALSAHGFDEKWAQSLQEKNLHLFSYLILQNESARSMSLIKTIPIIMAKAPKTAVEFYELAESIRLNRKVGDNPCYVLPKNREFLFQNLYGEAVRLGSHEAKQSCVMEHGNIHIWLKKKPGTAGDFYHLAKEIEGGGVRNGESYSLLGKTTIQEAVDYLKRYAIANGYDVKEPKQTVQVSKVISQRGSKG
ncbi:MAG: hypothetical protein ACYCQI_05500 [Gammaproteobacteria bacterium]